MRHPALRDAVFLAMNGVLSFDDALRVSPARRMAMILVVREYQSGMKFDWANQRWVDPR